MTTEEFGNVQVKVVNKEAMLQAINTCIGVKPNKVATLHDKYALISNKGKTVVIDEECFGQTDNLEVNVYYNDPTKPNQIAIMPELTVTFNFDELEFSDTVTLKEFMGSRYDYNSRIESNIITIKLFLGV